MLGKERITSANMYVIFDIDSQKNNSYVSLEIRETKSQIFCFCFTNFLVTKF